MTIFGPDLSSFQGVPDMRAVRAAGNDFAIIKATESTNYINPTFAPDRANAHAAGLAVGIYHFARATDAIAEAQFFLGTIGGLQPGEFLVLDWEVPGPGPSWSLAWLNAVHAATGQLPFVYMNQSTAGGANWSAVAAAGYRLWLAVYDGDPFTPPTGLPWWGSAAMKQYTDAASIPGVSGNCDRSAFYGTVDQLSAGGDMPLNDDDKAFITGVVRDSLRSEGISGAGDANVMLDRGYRAQFDALAAAVAKLQSGGLDPAQITAAVNEALKNIRVVTD